MEKDIVNQQLDVLHILRSQMDSKCYLTSVLNENERALLNLNHNRIISLKEERYHDLILTERR